jgi:hypothetical protein
MRYSIASPYLGFRRTAKEFRREGGDSSSAMVERRRA